MAREAGALANEPQTATDASGREAELAELLGEHDAARINERAGFVFVRGPAGVGKSHLFGLLRQALAARGTAVFEATSPREVRRPYGLFSSMVSQLFDHLGHDLGPASVRLAELWRVLSPLSRGGEPLVGVEQARRTLFDAICELFALAGKSHPAFLFHDLDAADRSSLELFRHLAAVSTFPEAKGGGLFVASFRDEPGALPAALGELVGKGNARSLPLAGLDADGIRAYLSRRELAERLFATTGGSPDVLEQMLSPEAPPTELFLHRVKRLELSQYEVLSVLAASFEAVPQELVTAVVDRLSPMLDAATALDALLRAHLVSMRVVDGRAVYRFARESEKQIFAQELGTERIARVRAALGEELSARGDVVGAAQVLLEVDPPGKGAAAALAAADVLFARGAHEDAADLYGRSLPHLTGQRRVGALHRLAESHAQQGDLRRAVRCLLSTRRGRTLSKRELTELSEKAARLLLRLGRLSSAQAVLARALQEPSTQAAAHVHLAEIELCRGRPDVTLDLVEHWLPSLGDDLERALTLRNLGGRAQLLKGELAAAEQLFAENQRLAQKAGLGQHAAWALHNLGVVAHKRGERDKAIACYQAVGSTHRPAQAKALANLGSLYADSGDFELALDHLGRALRAFARMGSQRDVAAVASNLARLRHFLGDFEGALELSEHALVQARRMGEVYLQGNALLNLGAVRLDTGEAVQAQKLFDEARASFERVGNDGQAALAAALKARAHLTAGERVQAWAELSRRCLEQGETQLTAAGVEAELARAELALLEQDLHGAGRAAARAREALLAQPDLEGPYRVYFLMGRLRRAAGDQVGAQAEMSRAVRMLDELTARVPAPRRAQFLSVPRRAEVRAEVEHELKLPRLQPPPGPAPKLHHGLVGRSSALTQVVRQLEPLGRSNATVLVRGESGTGKELVAEALHLSSPRRAMPLVKVNCAAMAEELLLSELFGHEKGAFTGAVRERKGRFELADGGTLFLDEIGDISPRCQVALLRVLQEKEFERVGGTKTLKVDVRVVCATNRELEALIAQGRFRQDLYYRLKGVVLELPPLRERLEDLPELAAHFLTRAAQERAESPKQLTPEALELLARHPWPGNVRELENVLASAAIFVEGARITPESFAHIPELAGLNDGASARFSKPVAEPVGGDADSPTSASPPSALDYYALARGRGLSLKDLRHEVETQCIRQALVEAKGNISKAARLLKMKRSRLSQIVNAEPTLKGVLHGN
ncbi:MAG: sigma 54-interacting transcriptional regulator [Myxococcota bacterium]